MGFLKNKRGEEGLKEGKKVMAKEEADCEIEAEGVVERRIVA